MNEPRRIFFGYSSKPDSVREAVATAAARLTEMGAANATTWESLRRGARTVIDQVLEAIDQSELIALDVTELNHNVMFELGYAIGKKKRVWLLRDVSLVAAKRKWEHVGLLSTVTYQKFTNSDNICTAFTVNRPFETEKTLYDDLIGPSAESWGSPSIFYIPSLHNTEASRALTHRIREERNRSLRVITADPTESSVQPLAWYAQEIAPAVAIIVHFSSQAREFADIHNARGALVAGLAFGMNRKVLMLAEDDYTAPIDYRDLLVRYGNAKQCAQAVNEWLERELKEVREELIRAARTAASRRPVRDLRSLRLGEHVAENEEDLLPEYFVETAGFDQVLKGVTAVFVGRKGSGKTANVIQAAHKLGRDPRNLVCVIKPAGYEWQALLRLIRRYETPDSRAYLLRTLWRFLLESEIARASVTAIKSRPAGPLHGTPDWELIRFVESEAGFLAEEFAVRLERAVETLSQVPLRDGVGEQRSGIAGALERDVVLKLRKLLGPVLTRRRRVAVLVDNLDKVWERGADFDELSRFLLALLTSISPLAKEFQKDYGWREPVPVTLTVFLRSDIYSRLSAVAREPDKIPTTRLEWTSKDMLRRVVEERYLAARGNSGTGPELWDRYFCAHIKNEPTRSYIANRVLPRPRDIIYLCNAAITAAINRGDAVVQPEDMAEAEHLYSQFAFEALQVEGEGWSELLEPVLFEFAGASPILLESDMSERIQRSGVTADSEEILARLRSLSFVGIETAQGSFSFADDVREKQIADRLATQFAASQGRPRRYKIHAAFRPYLGVNDIRMEGVLA